MNTMHQEGNALIYENDGELLRIEPWGKNSLRVRSVMQGPICDTDYALIELIKQLYHRFQYPNMKQVLQTEK